MKQRREMREKNVVIFCIEASLNSDDVKPRKRIERDHKKSFQRIRGYS